MAKLKENSRLTSIRLGTKYDTMIEEMRSGGVPSRTAIIRRGLEMLHAATFQYPLPEKPLGQNSGDKMPGTKLPSLRDKEAEREYHKRQFDNQQIT